MGIFRMAGMSEKPITWMGDSRKRLRELPKDVCRDVGIALHWAQQGRVHSTAKPMKGSLRDVMEIVSDFDGDTFRVMYTTRIGDELYVLHAFQKKSKRGAATPQHEVDLIENRLKAAKQLHAERSGKRDKR
jgi:phage-related protein